MASLLKWLQFYNTWVISHSGSVLLSVEAPETYIAVGSQIQTKFKNPLFLLLWIFMTAQSWIVDSNVIFKERHQNQTSSQSVRQHNELNAFQDTGIYQVTLPKFFVRRRSTVQRVSAGIWLITSTTQVASTSSARNLQHCSTFWMRSASKSRL